MEFLLGIQSFFIGTQPFFGFAAPVYALIGGWIAVSFAGGMLTRHVCMSGSTEQFRGVGQWAELFGGMALTAFGFAAIGAICIGLTRVFA